MSIFSKLFKKKEIQPIVLTVADAITPLVKLDIENIDPQIVSQLDSYQNAIDKLKQCLYGTMVDRSAEEKARGITRRKHAPDGWRHGASHPFVLDGKTYDVQETNDANVLLFEKLIQLIQKKYHIDVITVGEK